MAKESKAKRTAPGRKASGTGQKRPDFGQALAELEAIVAWFERGEADLDESLDKFERGLELAQACQERLKEAETRISKIKARFSSGN